MHTPKVIDYQRAANVVGGSYLHALFRSCGKMGEGAMLGWLAGHLGHIIEANSLGPDHPLSATRLGMRARSIKLLKDQLDQRLPTSPESLAALRLHIRTLFEAESMGGDRAAAQLHINILLRLDDPITDDSERLQNLMILMFNATELACKQCQRTVLPFGQSTQNALAGFWDLSAPYVPLAPEHIDEIHPCVTIPELREAMSTLRHILWIGESPRAVFGDRDHAWGDMYWGWATTRTFHDIGTLLNLYMDIVEAKILTGSPGSRLVQASMLLTYLFMVRKCFQEAVLETGTDVREASHVLVPRIEKHMTAAIELMTTAERLHYQEAMLWIFYAGALYEQRQEMKRKKKNPDDLSCQPFFSSALADHARQMGVTTWDQAQAVLQDFIYDRHLAPDGRLWFEDVVHSPDYHERAYQSLLKASRSKANATKQSKDPSGGQAGLDGMTMVFRV
jgi:hypothetical protein